MISPRELNLGFGGADARKNDEPYSDINIARSDDAADALQKIKVRPAGLPRTLWDRAIIARMAAMAS